MNETGGGKRNEKQLSTLAFNHPWIKQMLTKDVPKCCWYSILLIRSHINVRLERQHSLTINMIHCIPTFTIATKSNKLITHPNPIQNQLYLIILIWFSTMNASNWFIRLIRINICKVIYCFDSSITLKMNCFRSRISTSCYTVAVVRKYILFRPSY